MQQGLKQRLVGALVILALVVIFLPMLLQGPVERTRVDVPIQVPPEPDVGAEDTLPPPDFIDKPSPASESPDTRANGGGSGDKPAAGQTDTGTGPRPNTERSSQSQATAANSQPEADRTESEAEEDAGESGGEQVSEDTAPDGRPGSWVVQVGAFSNASNAERLRKRLAEAGFESAYRDRTQREGGVLYRVRLGPVAERTEAEAVLDRLKSSLELDGILVPR